MYIIIQYPSYNACDLGFITAFMSCNVHQLSLHLNNMHAYKAVHFVVRVQEMEVQRLHNYIGNDHPIQEAVIKKLVQLPQ